ncbi:hypothetical protein [Haemophilus parahaemolyticus]|nr:hypothetical protein [Haemophilus parahaemolyticus]
MSDVKGKSTSDGVVTHQSLCRRQGKRSNSANFLQNKTLRRGVN